MFNGKIHYKWPFSIAMLNYQRVAITILHRLAKSTYNGAHLVFKWWDICEKNGPWSSHAMVVYLRLNGIDYHPPNNGDEKSYKFDHKW
jgi:hypothetical protein